MQLGLHIGVIRTRRGISQQELADEIDKSPSYISYIETGKKGMSLETFVLIANTLNVSADELLIDSLENTIKVSNHAFANLLSDCTEFETKMMLDVAAAVKESLRGNRALYRSKR